MKRFFKAIKNFLLPPADSKTFLRVLPLVTIAFLVIVFFAVANYAWEETNTIKFCGLTCHTMPPQYITHENSAHTNVSCEDCHMGRDRLLVLIPRKVTYSWQTGTAMITNSYKYPIIAKNMAPAREACENCHKPEKFSSDKLVEIKHFADDANNTPSITSLVIKTGGGTARQGLGYGIHWHIENPVYYYSTDKENQNIPYVVVTKPDGSKTEYTNVETGFDPTTVKQDQLQKMDCITCHNRTAHGVGSPETIVDSLMTNGLVSPTIPEIKKKAVEVLSQGYPTEQAAKDAISALTGYYQQQQAEFYAKNTNLITGAVDALQAAYARSNFPDQKMDWQTHPDNIGHKDSPGCFRCHDGKHLTAAKEAIRLECNLCHSVPVVTGPDKFVTNIEVSRGPEPESHLDTSWINRHREVFDESCAACHTTEDPGGVSDQSFCSNSACHGSNWKFAGFDALKVREILGIVEQPTPDPQDDSGSQFVPTPTPTPSVDSSAGSSTGPVTFENGVSGILNKCTGCHGKGGQKGINLLTYQSVMAGGGQSSSPASPSPAIWLRCNPAPNHTSCS
jgi:hypothetical protein